MPKLRRLAQSLAGGPQGGSRITIRISCFGDAGSESQSQDAAVFGRRPDPSVRWSSPSVLKQSRTSEGAADAARRSRPPSFDSSVLLCFLASNRLFCRRRNACI